MARFQSHISTSSFLGIFYAGLGVLFLDTKAEHALLAAVLFALAGVLPNIDAKGEIPSKELTGLLAAMVPLALLQLFPQLQHGGIPRVALILIVCYLATRLVVAGVIERYTVHRGMVHSVPAAIITFEVVYLLFWDLFWFDRLYLAFAALTGFVMHLVMDGYGNLDLLNKALGKAEKKPKVLKVLGRTWGSTMALYSLIALLGWFMARDLYPQLKLFAGVTY